MKRQGAFLIAQTAVFALGILALWTPLSVDQAIFTYGGRTILAGEALYVDFWDIKPPGIFFFYALAGGLFGFAEPGLHLFELCWLLAAAAALTWIAARGVERPLVAAVAPLAAIGGYLVFAEPEHRTQVEALVVLPLAVALAAASRLARRAGAAGLGDCAGCGLALGLAAGVIGVFKLVYLPLPAVFALLAAAALVRRRGRGSWRCLARTTLFAGLGLLLVWLATVVFFATRGALGEFLWTTFVYPREALAGGARAPLSRLSESIGWAAGIWWPWLPLVLLGLVPARGNAEPVARWGAVAYLAVGTALIAIQTISWWSYHFVLLFPPLGLLASFGLDRALTLTRRWRRPLRAALALVLVALPAWTMARRAAVTVERLRAAAAIDSAAPLAVRLEGRYHEFWRGTRFLRQGGRPGDIFVFGDIRILLLSGRRQAIPVHGHTWALFPESFMRRLPRELMAAAPTYVYVTPYNRTVLEARTPDLVDFLDRQYVPVRQIAEGRLLARRP